MPETITKTYELISVKGVKGWIRDSWARRAIVALQQAIAAIVVPTASTANPQMNGTAAPGSSADYARADHIHPHDTSKADAATTYTKTEVNNLIPSVPSASTSNPAMDGTASPGSSTAWARGDHVHPSDTSKQDALSAAQLDAVNSGITAAKVANYDAWNNGVVFYNFTTAKVITITLSQASVGIIHLATRSGTTPKVDDIAISNTNIGHSNTSSLFTPAMTNSGKTITLTASGTYHGFLIMGGLFMQYITDITVTS